MCVLLSVPIWDFKWLFYVICFGAILICKTFIDNIILIRPQDEILHNLTAFRSYFLAKKLSHSANIHMQHLNSWCTAVIWYMKLQTLQWLQLEVVEWVWWIWKQRSAQRWKWISILLNGLSTTPCRQTLLTIAP